MVPANSADVVLMDMNMPGIGGLEATRKIARSVAGTKVIMLTVHTENPLPARSCRRARQAISVKAPRRRKW
ncbi:BarA-associated response regulator UvrY (GacA, SirA) [Klebsiella pneumoniae]|uniref:BarA-associated response regulator UvrY (GacA, SirA) n=1 Tax=Klebsiella pneumoniae TaxID=573 RepID=A0A2X3EFD6_KLEPN|nr:BarA-associated response regulator UvrY (GacA, SirA) [Klebsiella pneumoniae]